MDDLISRQQAVDALAKFVPYAICDESTESYTNGLTDAYNLICQLPSAQPFHNITMNDVLKYIDDMPEDVWQEFTACLECRGWELQRRTAKWCGGDFV